MPGASVTTGFFGKIPATGDFVARGLPSGFVRFWDSFVAQHLMPFVADGTLSGELWLGFAGGRAIEGPVAGVIVPSADKVGRKFPLTVACPVAGAPSDLSEAEWAWFGEVRDCALPARQGEIGADELAARLAALPFPAGEPRGAAFDGLLMWREWDQPLAVDPAAPRVELERLLALSPEAG